MHMLCTSSLRRFYSFLIGEQCTDASCNDQGYPVPPCIRSNNHQSRMTEVCCDHRGSHERKFPIWIICEQKLWCRAGSLYGELARFILRILGYKSKAKPQQMPGMPGGPGGMLPGPMLPGAPAPALPPPEAPAFDSVWGS